MHETPTAHPKGRKPKKRPKLVETPVTTSTLSVPDTTVPFPSFASLSPKTDLSTEEKTPEPELSEYEESDSYDSDAEFTKFGSKSEKVKTAYRTRAKGKNFKINTSSGLRDLVEAGETGHYAANTHLLYRRKTDPRYAALQLNSAYGTRVALGRYRKKGVKGGTRIDVSGNSVRIQQKKYRNVHGEMQLLYQLTGGEASKIPDALKGYVVIVDKATCADCIEFVRSAAPDELRDGTTGMDSNEGRTHFANWTNPFNGEKRNVSTKRKR